MSVVTNKNNIKTWTTDNHNKEQLRPHITENIGLTEEQKIVMVRDRSTPTQDMSPEGSHSQKKFFFN